MPTTNKSHFLISTILLVLFQSSAIIGQETQIQAARKWKLRNGSITVEGVLVDVEAETVTIERKNSKSRITVSISELSQEDKDFIKNRSNDAPVPVDKKHFPEKERINTNTIESFFDLLNPLLKEFEAPVSKDETSVQAERRKQQAWEKLMGNIRNQEFSILAQVKDVKTARIKYDFTTQLMMNGETPQQEAERLANERSIFDVEIQPKNYPFDVPRRFRCKIGSLAEKLQVGTILRIECRTGESDKQIGKIRLSLGALWIDCGILAVTVDDSKVAKEYISSLQNIDDSDQKPLFDCAKIDKAEFRKAFSKIEGADPLTVSVIDRERLYKFFGAPAKSITVGSRNYLKYQCADGSVVLEIPIAVGNGLPENHIMIISINDQD